MFSQFIIEINAKATAAEPIHCTVHGLYLLQYSVLLCKCGVLAVLVAADAVLQAVELVYQAVQADLYSLLRL